MLLSHIRMMCIFLGDLFLFKKMDDFLSLTENQKFRLCGLVYEGSVPTNKLKKYTLELPDKMNSNKFMLLDLEFNEYVLTTAVHCVIRTPENREDQFYVILDPSNIHSVFSAIPFKEIEGNSVMNIVLWLIHRFVNVPVLYFKLTRQRKSP